MENPGGEAIPFFPEAFGRYKELLQRTGEIRCKVVTDSMEPLLPVGQTVGITGVKQVEDLRIFDIIVFVRGKQLFCHFFWHRSGLGGGVITRSLKEYRVSEPPVPFDHVLGRVVDRKIPLLTKIRIVFGNLFWRSA